MEIHNGLEGSDVTPNKYLDLQNIGEPKELKYELGSVIILKQVIDLLISLLLYPVQNTCGQI